MNFTTKQSGFSLIELIVTVVIIGILAAVSIPSFKSSLDQSDLSEADAIFKQAVGRAKAQAMRNQYAKSGNQSVMRVCLSATNEVSLHEDALNSEATCSAASSIWKNQIDSDISVTVNGTAFSCMCFNNKGRIENTTACGNDNCAITNDFTFTLDSQTLETEVF